MAADRLSFEGRVAIVTGAGGSRGLGRAHARLLASRGAKVVVNDTGCGRDGMTGEAADAHAVVAEIVAAGGEAIASLHSVADEAGSQAIVAAALEAWGRVDILINNAMVGAHAPFADVPSDRVRAVLDVNLMGGIWMCRAAWPHMIAAGHGRIVNTTSGAMMGMVGTTAYAAAKFGLYGLTRGLAAEGVDHGIRVNSVSPGAATNSLGRSMTISDPDQLRRYRDAYPADLVAPVFAYLAHESCRISGALLNAGGGIVSARLIGATGGIADPALTIERVRDNLDLILDPQSLAIVTDPADPRRTGNSPIADTLVRRN